MTNTILPSLSSAVNSQCFLSFLEILEKLSTANGGSQKTCSIFLYFDSRISKYAKQQFQQLVALQHSDAKPNHQCILR